MITISALISIFLAGETEPAPLKDESWHNPHRCGPIALYSICSSFEIRTTISELEDDCGFDGRGVSIAGIVAAANRKGIVATPYHSSVRHLSRLRGPAIIDYPAGHFCVYFGWKQNKAILYDPPEGRIEASKDELEADWGKHVIVFSR